MGSASLSYKGHRYPVEVISSCVWLYHRFPLSFREVEELMLERGIVVSYETVRRWCAKFGQVYAGALRRRQPRPGDKWHLDEVFIEINGEQKYLWRAVDQDGNVLDILVQNRRDKAAARRFLRRLMKKTRRVPRVVVTDKLRSYGAAHREVIPSVEHRSHKGLNNRAENSHQPTRQRERAMKGFRSAGGAQRFLSASSGISPHFRPHRHLMPAHDYRAEMTVRFAIWEHITGLARLATAAASPPGAFLLDLSSGQGETHRPIASTWAHSTAPPSLRCAPLPRAGRTGARTAHRVERTGWTRCAHHRTSAPWVGAHPPHWCAPTRCGGAVSGAHRVRSASRARAPGAHRASPPGCRRCPGDRGPE